MPHWIRFERDGAVGFGTLEGDAIAIFEGNMFDRPTATGRTWPLGLVRLLAPTRPTKMIALWNNFRALGAKLGVAAPEDPLYLLKATSCVTRPGRDRAPPGLVWRQGGL